LRVIRKSSHAASPAWVGHALACHPSEARARRLKAGRSQHRPPPQGTRACHTLDIVVLGDEYSNALTILRIFFVPLLVAALVQETAVYYWVA